MITITTKELSAKLAHAILGSDASPTAKYVLSQALLALVQVAKLELWLQLQQLESGVASKRMCREIDTDSPGVSETFLYTIH